MSRKTKRILQILGAICALSLILNVVLFSCLGSSDSDKQIQTLTDSVKAKTEVIQKQKETIKAMTKDQNEMKRIMGEQKRRLDDIDSILKKKN